MDLASPPMFDATVLSRVEDASLNASAPPQQRWLDGWLLRTNPGKAQRARCVNALAEGRLPWQTKLAEACSAFAAAGLPALVRITPYTQPPQLDGWLHARGWLRFGETCVLLRPPGQPPARSRPLPAGLRWQTMRPDAFAATIAGLRGSSPDEAAAHAQRLHASPVPCQGLAIVDSDGQALACGQAAWEGSGPRFVGLYDIHTRSENRNQGLATIICEYLLSLYATANNDLAYLQVDAENPAAHAVYRRLGFQEAYRYHYRRAPA